MVNKATLVARIAELVGERKLEGIADLNDESDRQGMRIVIELKKDARALTVLNNLYKHTALQTTFGVISLALVDGRPVVLNLKALLQHHVDHRRDVITRRTRYDLDRARERAHLLEGLKIALDNLDAVIKTIRESPDEKTVQERLQERFKLSERQSQAIVDMRLGRLTRLERNKVMEEYEEVIKRIAYLEDLLQHEAKIMLLIKDDLGDLKKKYGDARRTTLDFQGSVELNEEDLVPKEDVVVTLTHRGYVKRVPATTYRPQRRGGKGILGAARVESDFVEHLAIASTHSDMLFFTNHGSVFRLRVHEIPDVNRQAKGLPAANLIDIDPKDKITALIVITPLAEYPAHSRGGQGVYAMAVTDRTGPLVGMRVVVNPEEEQLIVISEGGQVIRTPIENIRVAGRQTQGVIIMRLDEGDTVATIAGVGGTEEAEE